MVLPPIKTVMGLSSPPPQSPSFRQMKTELDSFSRSTSSFTGSTHSSVWPCTFCPQKFSLKRELINHMSSVHDAKGEIRCEICDKMFSSRGNLKCHMVNHTGGQRFQCTICGKKFATKENFTGHMNVHAGAKPFQCTQCLKCFAYKNHLSSHRKNCPAMQYTATL